MDDCRYQLLSQMGGSGRTAGAENRPTVNFSRHRTNLCQAGYNLNIENRLRCRDNLYANGFVNG